MAQRAQRLVHDLGGAGGHEHHVAHLGLHSVGYRAHLLQREETRHRRAHLLLRQIVQGRAGFAGQRDGDQSLCAAGLGEVDQLVGLAAGVGGQAGRPEALYDAAARDRRLEHAKVRLRRDVRQVRKLEVEAQVRLVRAVQAHRVGVGDPGKRPERPLVREERLDEGDVHLLDQVEHVVLFHEAHLEVELGVPRAAGRPAGPRRGSSGLSGSTFPRRTPSAAA